MVAVLDNKVGDSLVAADLARRPRRSQLPSAPCNRAGSPQSVDTLAQQRQFSGAESFLTHNVCAVSVRCSSAGSATKGYRVRRKAGRRRIANELSDMRCLPCADTSHLGQCGGVDGDDPFD